MGYWSFWGGRRKSVIFNHEVPLFTALSLSLCLSVCLLSSRTTFNSAVAFNSVCSRDSPSNRPVGVLLTAPQGVAVKGEIWTVKDSIAAALATPGLCKEPNNGRRFSAPVVCVLFIQPQGPVVIHCGCLFSGTMRTPIYSVLNLIIVTAALKKKLLTQVKKRDTQDVIHWLI